MHLEYQPFSLDLTAPLETAAGSIERRRGFLVKVFDEDGIVGYGEASPLPGWTESYDQCERALERAADTGPDVSPSVVISAVESSPAARHGVALAFADYHATRASTPMYRHLGCPSLVARVPVHATIGDRPADDTVAFVNDAVAAGFETCKLKVGNRSLEADIDRVRRTREAAGPDVALRVDANGAWSPDEAHRAIDAFAEIGVELLEQPLPAESLDAHASLRGYGVAIGIDEGLIEHGLDAVCEADAADVIVLKPMALGGIDVAQEIAAWIRQLDITPIVTTTIDAVVARTAAVHLAAALPEVSACGLATGSLLADDLGSDPVLVENGAAVVPQAKGLGVENL